MTKKRVSLCPVPGDDHSPGRLRRGMCDRHYRRMMRNGSPEKRVRPDAHQRFNSFRTRTVQGCWEWQGHLTRDGYGVFRLGRKQVRAHRWAYERVFGRIPDGKEIDHKCRNRACVRPSHLRAVSHRTNILASPRWQVTHCPQNHPYTGDNVFFDLGKRRCRICQRERNRRAYRRRMEKKRKEKVA